MSGAATVGVCDDIKLDESVLDLEVSHLILVLFGHRITGKLLQRL